MDYTYTVIYRFEGIAATNLEKDMIVYEDDSLGVAVTLTNDVNRHCLILDRGLACASLLLRGMFGDEKAQELPIAIEAEVTKIQEERVSKKSSAGYAVITIKGQAELDIKDNLHRETEQFRICFDAIDKDSLRKAHEETIHSIISSLSISTSPEYHAEKIASGTHFIDSSDKLLYSFTMQGGRARMILAKPIDTEKEKDISKVIGLSCGNALFKTPFRLLTQSLETTQDELRAFIAAWTALEILTNKIFSTYEEKFISGIADDHNSHGVNQFLVRIKDVMKDKYRLTDKFSLIASFLSDDISGDIELFKSMKKIRDNISHGKEFDEETLPVESARKMVAKYLKSHMFSEENA